ncbi:MAG: hypothetical protein ACI96M_001647 [Candidatus Azotimanducaceae bacterium]
MSQSTCLCGLFTTSVVGSLGEVRYCHCSQCRRKTGTPFTANAKINSSLYARSDSNSEDIRIRLGGFDSANDVSVTGHVWVSSKAEWYSIDDDIPQFEESYPAQS